MIGCRTLDNLKILQSEPKEIRVGNLEIDKQLGMSPIC